MFLHRYPCLVERCPDNHVIWWNNIPQLRIIHKRDRLFNTYTIRFISLFISYYIVGMCKLDVPVNVEATNSWYSTTYIDTRRGTISVVRVATRRLQDQVVDLYFIWGKCTCRFASLSMRRGTRSACSVFARQILNLSHNTGTAIKGVCWHLIEGWAIIHSVLCLDIHLATGSLYFGNQGIKGIAEGLLIIITYYKEIGKSNREQSLDLINRGCCLLFHGVTGLLWRLTCRWTWTNSILIRFQWIYIFFEPKT